MQLLRDTKQAESQNNLYEHIVEVIDKLVVHYPDAALEKFEEVSYLLKHQGQIDINQFLKLTEQLNYAKHDDQTAAAT